MLEKLFLHTPHLDKGGWSDHPTLDYYSVKVVWGWGINLTIYQNGILKDMLTLPWDPYLWRTKSIQIVLKVEIKTNKLVRLFTFTRVMLHYRPEASGIQYFGQKDKNVWKKEKMLSGKQNMCSLVNCHIKSRCV